VPISTTYFCKAFMGVAPKSVRIQSSCKYLFKLLGSTPAKSARKMMMKFTRKCFSKLFSSYSLALNFMAKEYVDENDTLIANDKNLSILH